MQAEKGCGLPNCPEAGEAGPSRRGLKNAQIRSRRGAQPLGGTKAHAIGLPVRTIFAACVGRLRDLHLLKR